MTSDPRVGFNYGQGTHHQCLCSSTPGKGQAKGCKQWQSADCQHHILLPLHIKHFRQSVWLLVGLVDTSSLQGSLAMTARCEEPPPQLKLHQYLNGNRISVSGLSEGPVMLSTWGSLYPHLAAPVS